LAYAKPKESKFYSLGYNAKLLSAGTAFQIHLSTNVRMSITCRNNVPMKNYHSKSGKDSGVTAYESGPDYIIIQFAGGETYRYSYRSCGRVAVEEMKQLALQQEGLSTFISRHDPKYDWKR
jgi:hypothetical protein